MSGRMREKLLTREYKKSKEETLKEIDRKWKKGYFKKWGEFKYRWNKKGERLVLSGVVWRAEVVFGKKGVTVYAQMPFWVKPMVKPILRKEIDRLIS